MKTERSWITKPWLFFIKPHKFISLKHLLTLNTNFVTLGVFCLIIASILTFTKGFVELLLFSNRGNLDLFNRYLPSFLRVDLPNEFDAVICKILETNLIGLILFVCAMGIYFLLWRNRSIPTWLHFEDINQLKEKLIGIVITTLGVTFLEHVLEWNDPKGVLMFGVAISLVILVLVLYNKILASENSHTSISTDNSSQPFIDSNNQRDSSNNQRDSTRKRGRARKNYSPVHKGYNFTLPYSR